MFHKYVWIHVVIFLWNMNNTQKQQQQKQQNRLINICTMITHCIYRCIHVHMTVYFQSSSTPGTPKHGSGLKNEVCLVCFQKENANGLVSKLTESMVRHLEGIRLSFKPFYSIYGVEDIRLLPPVKLFVVVVDLESRGFFINGSERDLVLMTVKCIKSFGGKIL